MSFSDLDVQIPPANGTYLGPKWSDLTTKTLDINPTSKVKSTPYLADMPFGLGACHHSFAE
jgi:hypothetical protein